MDVTGLANEDLNPPVPSIERSSPDPLTQPMPPYEIGAVTQFTTNTPAPATIPSSVSTGPEKRTSSNRQSIHQTPPRLAPAMNANLGRKKTRPGTTAFLSLCHSPQDPVEAALDFLVHAASIADIQERRNLPNPGRNLQRLHRERQSFKERCHHQLSPRSQTWKRV